MHLDMNKDLLRINSYMQVPQITPNPPVSILKSRASTCRPIPHMNFPNTNLVHNTRK